MKIRVYNTEIGHCTLTDEHAQSSYGQLVLVADDGTAYGPGDVPLSYLHVGIDEPGRDWSDLPRVSYTPEQVAALRAVTVAAWSRPYGTAYHVGASIQALLDMPSVLAEAQKIKGSRIYFS